MPHTDKLLDRWSQKRSDEKFIKDGIVNITKWDKSSEKILFLLKEVNVGPESYSATLPLDVQTDFRKTADQAPWKEIGQWAYGIINRKTNPEFTDANTKSNFTDACRSVAIVNLKKTAGTNSSNSSLIRKFANQDREFLSEQIDLIGPRIIVCCGKNLNFNIAKEIFVDAYRAELTYQRNDFIPGKLFRGKKYFWIDYVHPQMREGSHETKFSSLLDIAKNIP